MACPATIILAGLFRAAPDESLAEIPGGSSQGMGNDLALIIFDERVRHAVKQRIFSHRAWSARRFTPDDVSRGGIAQIVAMVRARFSS